jgi:hypothetical protein
LRAQLQTQTLAMEEAAAAEDYEQAGARVPVCTFVLVAKRERESVCVCVYLCKSLSAVDTDLTRSVHSDGTCARVSLSLSL